MAPRLESVIDARLANNSDAGCFWWDGKWYSKKDFLKLVDECEASLKASGFKAGQRLVVLMPNCPMIPALSLALWRLGGTICPLNVKSGMISLTQTIDLIEPFAVVAGESISKEAAPALKEHGYGCVTCGLMEPLPTMEGRLSQYETEDTAVIFATSGTTGLPKAVPLTHDNIRNNCERTSAALTDIKTGDVFLTVLPNFHSFGYTVATIMPLTIDAKLAIVPGFLPPKQTVKALMEAKCNILFVVPTIMSYLLSSIGRGSMPKEALSQAKLIITGGDRLQDNMHDIAKRLIGKDIMEGYGLTETSPVLALNSSYETHRPGTVGPILSDYQWKLLSEKGEPSDKKGVLWVKGPSVTPGYFRAPEVTAERFKDGWFNTGDYVRIEDGYLKILDRVTDIIIVGGFNVYPQEVELVLQSHPAVQTAIVVGMPNSINGEVPKAFIQKKEDTEVSELEIVKYCKERLAHYKVPRKVEFVDDFPLSGTGKILRRVLRERERNA